MSGGFRYQHYDARGSEHSYNSYEFLMGLRRELPYGVTLDLSGSIALRPYDNPSTFPDPPGQTIPPILFQDSDRDEQTYVFDATLERPITRWLTGSIYYTYWDNDSNVDVYDYDQNIVGFLLTVPARGFMPGTTPNSS